jgi:hypothetical protein
MVYMTTGSGSAPLNAAGILMIKQWQSYSSY